MANGDIKITELPVGILVQGSLFITSEPEQGGGYASTKISATDIATLVASIVSYASLNTTSKTVIGAINEILSKAEGKFIVVQTLPVSDIDPFAIYLVPKQTPGQSDFYDEYIFTNNAWEKIGTTDIDLSNYYTKTQVDSLLSAKADTSSLATVATTGNYNDLTNKPTIPQIADNVIGSDSTYSSQKIISLMPTGEASGAVASFNTEIAAPLVDCKLSINAQQASGTPTPDDPLSITGYNGMTISHSDSDILNPDTISISWQTEAGTVYGGELDLLSGVLTVNKGGKIYTGANSENWFTEYDYNFYGDVVTGAKTGQTIQCSIATSTGTVYTGNLNAWISNSGRINITIPTITHTVEDFRQLLTDLNNNNTPMMIVYELATPIEIQLDPQQMSAFIGENNIWHDANGDISVKFKQDIENYIADQLASQLANSSRSLNLSKSAPAETEIEIKEEIKEKESEENKR